MSQTWLREGYRGNKSKSGKIESRLLPDSGNSLVNQGSDENFDSVPLVEDLLGEVADP